MLQHMAHKLSKVTRKGR